MINIVPKTIFEMSTEEQIKQIKRNYERAMQDMGNKSKNWKENYEYYLGLSEARTQEGTGHALASVFIPKIGEKVDWLTARIKQAIFNYRPIINITSKDEKEKTLAQIYEDVIDYQLFRIPQIRRKFNDLIKEGQIYNTGVIKVYWDFDLNQPVFDTIARKNFFPDPYARYISECKWAIQRYYMGKDALWALRKQGKTGIYDPAVLQELFKKGFAVYEEEGSRQEQLESQEQTVTPSEEGRYEILEYWTGKGLITVALWTQEDNEGMTVLRVEKDIFAHQKLPFLTWVFNPKPNEFNGFGTVEQVKDIQDEINTKHRQILDHASFTIKPRWIGTENMFSSSQEMLFEQNIPGSLIKTKSNYDPSKIRPLQVAPIQGDALAELQAMEMALENRTGIYRFAQGQPTARKETATTVVNLLSRSDLLFASIFEDFAEDILRPLGEMFVELNHQFNTEKIKTNRVDEEGNTTEITLKGVKGDFDYSVNVSAVKGSNEMQRAQLMQLIQLTTSNPAIARMLNLKEILKQLLNTFDQIKNAESLMTKEIEQMPQMLPSGKDSENMFTSPLGAGMPQAGMMPGVPNVPVNNAPIPNTMKGFV